MNDLLPLAPQAGLATHFYLPLVLGIGVLFGFALERAGFGSAKNLTAIFILRDFRVFRVMFTAVLTAMLGAHLLHFLGLLNLALLPVDPNYFWPIALGGLVFGVGFYVGGFCPGTAVVALARGRWDSLAFLCGITLGIYFFAELYDAVGASAWFRDFYAPADAAATTLYEGGPAWPWIAGITAAALAGFWITPRIERRFALRTVAQLRAGRAEAADGGERDPRAAAVRRSPWRWAGAAVAVLAVAAIAVAEHRGPHLDFVDGRPRPAAVLADEGSAIGVSARTLAGWLIEDARRRDEGSLSRLLVLDARGADDRRAVPIPGTREFAPGNESVPALAGFVIRLLRREEAPAAAALVIIGSKPLDEPLVELVSLLRRYRIRAHLMEGGGRAWQREVLDWEPAPGSLSDAGLDALALAWGAARAWLAGRDAGPPPRFVFPGAIPPETAVTTVAATGSGAGGGCN